MGSFPSSALGTIKSDATEYDEITDNMISEEKYSIQQMMEFCVSNLNANHSLLSRNFINCDVSKDEISVMQWNILSQGNYCSLINIIIIRLRITKH